MAGYLSRKGIAFTKKDVRADADALEELLRGGFQSTPVTLVDGQAVVGFDAKAIDALVGAE